MAKNMQAENYKKNKNSKQPSKSNLQYNEYKSNEKINSRSTENNLNYNKETNLNQNNLKKGSTSAEVNSFENNKSNIINRKNENNGKRNNFVETKIKSNFTIRGYRRKPDGRRKRNDIVNNVEFPVQANRNRGRIETKNGRYNSKPTPWTSSSSNSDQYLEAGTYEGEELLIKDGNSREKMFSDDDTYSILSDITDFCQREQYNVECYNYYLNFGDPYVMNNGEISTTENGWYYDRQPNFGRVFYYRSQFNDLCYESGMRYNYPNHQEFKYRNIEAYAFCNPRGVCMNNYMPNGYLNGYMEPPGLLPNEYYPYQMGHPQEFIPDRYFKPVVYEEPDDVLNSNQYTQENDTLNVINLNSSLVVYNSNVHINTVHNEIYGLNTVSTNDAGELMDNDENNINDNNTAADVSVVNTDKDTCREKDISSTEFENFS